MKQADELAPAADAEPSFGGMLRDHRIAARLTQAALADRAGVSARALQDLERSSSRPHRDTLHRLATALELSPEAQALLRGAAVPKPRRGTINPDRQTEAPPSGRHNLPLHLTSFVGRQPQLDETIHLLQSAGLGARLVTLIGAGGVGKTRLALKVAESLSRVAFPDGLHLIELAPLTDPERVPQSIAAVVGLREVPGRTYAELLIDALRQRRMLLIMDNCEHLAYACAHIVRDILRGCPGISVLATSRAPLGILGEKVLAVPPLDRPPAAAVQSLAELRRCDAVRLFAERAAAVSSGFVVDSANAFAVADICRRLDGIPLALELAAAQTRALSAEQITQRLDQCLSVLAGGDRTAPLRQQTLEAAVAWSYDLLDEREQRFFTRLAVFAGGWSLEAAEAICADDRPTSDNALQLLRRLIDNSLVVVEDGHDRCKWYRLLEPIRQFGAEKLRLAGGESPLRTRHFGWYLQLVVEAERLVRFTRGPASTKLEALARLEANHDNLRRAWQWAAFGDGDVRAGLRLVGALLPFHFSFGFRSEGRAWIAALLERDDPACPSRERASALSAAAGLAAQDGDDAAARAYAAEYLRLPPSLRDHGAEAVAYDALGTAALRDCDGAAAVAFYTRTVALSRSASDVSGSIFLTQLGDALRFQRDLDGAQRTYEEALADAQTGGVLPAVGLALRGLAAVAWSRSDFTAAEALYDQALTLLDDIGALPHEVHLMLVSAGNLALHQGDLGRAHARFAEALDRATAAGHPQAAAAAMKGVALLQLERAAA
jgi:non-specific serine/threonine protein kinase